MLRRTKILTLALILGLVASAAFAQVDFTRYVSLGDSLTAGFWSGGLVSTVQVNSYPALLYRQATGSSTGFEQPLVKAPGIPAALQLVSLVPNLVIAPASGQGVPLNLNLPRPYNNLGVPGSRVHDTLATTNGGLHDLILRNPNFGNTTALQQALILKPTFVTLWIGNNDVLGAATSGIVIDGVTLTTLDSFTQDYRAIMANLKASGAKIAVANIPDVTSIPFVTTVPSVVVNPATRKPVLGPDGKPIPLIGPGGRLLTSADHVLLTAQTDLGKGLGIPAALGGTNLPLPDGDVLDAAETAKIQDRINNFNAVIAQAANDAGAALVDANALLRDLANHGLDIGGVTFTNAFLTGGVFSYDGVHPTPFGYAVVANAFIDAINAKFSANIPEVDLYPFVFGPQSAGGTPAGAALAGSAQLSPEAVRNLFWVLGVDAKGDGNGGNGGNGGGTGGGGGTTPTTTPRSKPAHRSHGG
jgi:lysophospholipase L1-like esterase